MLSSDYLVSSMLAESIIAAPAACSRLPNGAFF
jgi:hypothetical protein